MVSKEQFDDFFQRSRTPAFEISIIVKDSLGRPLLGKNGQLKRRSFASDDAEKLAAFYYRHQGRPKHKKRRAAKKGDVVPSGKEAEKILNQVAEYAEAKQEKRKVQ